MSEHEVEVRWSSDDAPFTYEGFVRDHVVRLASGLSIEASAAGAWHGDPTRANPEELFAAALASCHMMTFLSVAARRRKRVLAYEDHALARVAEDEEGRLALVSVVLRPRVVFEQPEAVDEPALRRMHALAHAHCFIARACRCEIRIEPLVE